MIGVFSFYTTLFESTFDKKLSTISYNLIPRFYVYNMFNFVKSITLILNKKFNKNTPIFNIRSYINYNSYI